MATPNSNTPARDEAGDDVHHIARWLATQCATQQTLTESTAWRLIDEARQHPLPLGGPHAPLVVQPRFSIWTVGQLGGEPTLRMCPDEEAARIKARELAAEMMVPVLVIDRGGEIEERFEPPGLHPRPVLRVERHEGRWAVFVEGRIVATAPTRERARQQARALREDPDFFGDHVVREETPTVEA